VYFKIRNINEHDSAGQTLFEIKKEEKDWGQSIKE
jgi:hypothetical protein